MLQILREVLGRNIGNQLTPEMALGIFSAVEAGLSARPDLRRTFEPQTKGDFTFAAERLDDVLPELLPLWRAHWDETETHRHDVQEFNPDIEAYRGSELDGNYILFTVRTGGKLIGNCGVYLSVSRHSQRIIASEDTLYLLPEHRGAGVGSAFLRYMVDCVRSVGATEIRATVKTVNNADALLRKFGFKHVAEEFSYTGN